MSRRRNYKDSSEGSSDEEEGGRAKRRRRVSESIDIEERLESLITRVGEKSTSSLESNLEGLASVLEADLSNYKQTILKILAECVVTMPEKMTVYTTLAGLLNAKNYNAGGEFVELLIRTLKEALKTGEHDNAMLTVRFLSDLVNCRVISAVSLLALYNNFVDVTLEDSIPQVRSDFYVYMVLSTLPWVGQELSAKKEPELDAILSAISHYIHKRQKSYVPAIRVWSSDEPHPQEEYLDCLWAQISLLRRNRWEEHQITRPYLGFDSVLCEALQHTLPQVIPPTHTEDSTYPLPRIIFRMFDYTDVPEGPVLPGSHAIERWLLETLLTEQLNLCWDDKRACAAALLQFPVKGKIPLNYMIVEVVFSQLFNMPRPPYLDLFYGSLLIELCKLQPGSMPQVLALATEMLYERLDTMNASCIERFANWFSYHLSNFQFRWSWEDWAECLEMSEEMPKPMFVKETLLKCMRLSYHQRVVELVPDNFAKLLPVNPQPFYKYEKEGASALTGTMTAHLLMQAIKAKCSPEAAVTMIKELPNPLAERSDVPVGYNPLKIDVFVQSLLYLAAKSFSHSFAAISKFHPVLKALGEAANNAKQTQEAQICVLKSMHELWHNHQQMMVVLVDKLLKTQVVECAAVATWLFSPEMAGDFTNCYVWEIMHSTIKKMNKQVSKLQKEIDEMRDRVEAVQQKRREGFDFDDDDDVPTEEMIEREQEKLDEAQSAQKNLFLIIFQRFIMILSEHLARCESAGRDINSPWYKWTIDRLQQVFLLHHEQVYTYVHTLESLMFTGDVDSHILEVFHQFCALRA